MKRVVGLFVLGLILAVPAVLFAAKAEKVRVEHLADTVIAPDGVEVELWKVLEISGNALDAHLAHGDVETTLPKGTKFTVPPGYEDLFEDLDDDMDDEDEVEEEG